MLVSETIYRHQVAADIRPFSDVLIGLFFVTIGMQLNLGYVATNLSWVVAMLALLVAGKGLIVLALSLALRNPLPIALNTALHLAQAGEFGFVLVVEAANTSLFDPATRQVALASMLLSMLITPLLIEHGSRLFGSLTRREAADSLHDLEDQVRHVDGHVIICSYGRMGQSVARFLDLEAIPFVVLDTDQQRVREATAAGERVVYGDADQQVVLLAAGLRRAKAEVIAYADVAMALKVLRVVRQTDPNIPVIVRAADDSQLDVLKKEGATEVVPEILEGGLMLAVQTLGQLGSRPRALWTECAKSAAIATSCCATFTGRRRTGCATRSPATWNPGDRSRYRSPPTRSANPTSAWVWTSWRSSLWASSITECAAKQPRRTPPSRRATC